MASAECNLHRTWVRVFRQKSRQAGSYLLMFYVVLCTGRCADPLPDIHNPNHLEPISSADAVEYEQAVFNLLIGPNVAELWMICRPTGSQEYALILRTEPLVPSTIIYQLQFQQKKWVLEAATATQQIWGRIMQFEMGNQQIWPWTPKDLDPRKGVKVDRKQITIDANLAKNLQAAWENVLRLTRYSDVTGVYQEFAGPNYYEFNYRWYSGGIWSPTVGIPSKLVSLADRLYKLTQESPSNAHTIEKECSEMAKRLADEAIEEHKRTNH